MRDIHSALAQLERVCTCLRELAHARPPVNPRRACAARVTVLGLCVCLSVCLSIDIIYSRNRDGKLRLTGRYYARCIHDVTNTTFRST